MKIPVYPKNRDSRTLLPHQKPVLKYMMTTRTPALFIDMRLGKTILTIEYAIRKGLQSVLVLAPMSALNSWERELAVESITCCKVAKPKSKKLLEDINTASWVVTNPQKLISWPFAKRKWDLIVIDESSRIKNARSKYYKTLMRDYSKVPHRLLLSGTPTPESILEAVPQLLFLHGSVLGCKSYWEFISKYTVQYGYERVPYKSTVEKLQTLLHTTCYFLSQKKAGVAQPYKRKLIYVKKTEEQKKYFKQLKDEYALDLGEKHYETEYALPILMWACRIAGGVMDEQVVSERKYDALKYVLSKHKGSVVVWYRFNEELHYCKDRLQKDGYTVRAYYGDLNVEQRKELERGFKRGEYKVLLMQIKTGLYALDLSRANVAVYYSNSWSLEERIQSEKRISHPRKKSTLTYYDILLKGWPDTTIHNALKKKNISAKIIWEGRHEI